MDREDIDARRTHAVAGSSVEIVTDSSPERNQEVVQRTLPYQHETPEEFRERIDNEEE
jgi:hypothetical protein